MSLLTRIHMLGDSVHQGPVDNLLDVLVPGVNVVGYSVCLEGEQDPRKEIETFLVTGLVCNKWTIWTLSCMYKSPSSFLFFNKRFLKWELMSCLANSLI